MIEFENLKTLALGHHLKESRALKVVSIYMASEVVISIPITPGTDMVVTVVGQFLQAF